MWIAAGKSACVTYNAGAQTALDKRAAGVNAEVCRAHDIVSQHFAAVIADPVFVHIAHAAHNVYDTAHIEIIVSLLSAGTHDRASSAGKDRSVPVGIPRLGANHLAVGNCSQNLIRFCPHICGAVLKLILFYRMQRCGENGFFRKFLSLLFMDSVNHPDVRRYPVRLQIAGFSVLCNAYKTGVACSGQVYLGVFGKRNNTLSVFTDCIIDPGLTGQICLLICPFKISIGLTDKVKTCCGLCAALSLRSDCFGRYACSVRSGCSASFSFSC